MATFDIKSPGAQKLLLAILLAGGAVGVYFGTHLLPWTVPSGGEKIAKSQIERGDFEAANETLLRLTGMTSSDYHLRRIGGGIAASRRRHHLGVPHRGRGPSVRPASPPARSGCGWRP